MRNNNPSFKEIGVSKTQLLRGSVQRAKALSIPKKIYIPIIRKVNHWYKCSGEDWTVDRLKAVKLDIIRYQAGMPPVSGNWIAHNSSGLKGEFRALQDFMQISPRNFSKGIQLLQIYTLFYSSSVTEKQYNKFISGVTADPPLPSVIEQFNSIIERGFDLLPFKMIFKDRFHRKPLADMIPSMSRRAPLPNCSVDEQFGLIDSLRYLFETTEGFNHYIKYKDIYKEVMGDLYEVLRDPYNRSTNHSCFDKIKRHGSFLVGRIGLIQEPGHKLRAVANPGRVFQRILEPFGEKIYSLLKLLPYDCTHDQSKAFPVLQEALLNGKTIHSIDLSGATDYFPLALQEHLLFKMFPRIEVSLFSDLSKASWFTPGKGEISWRRGQPLGLYPSFGAFALTHGCLLLGLLNKEFNNEFFVLGDDVVILDDQLALDYYNALEALSCPVSIPKSLQSNSLCEFGGRLITSTLVIPQYKWRGISDESFIDLAKILGPSSLHLFKPRQVKVLNRLAPIPDFLGGLGWNPNGLPLEDRCQDHLIWSEDLPVDHLMDYSAVRIRNVLSSNVYSKTIFTKSIGIDTIWIDKDRDLDQRSSIIVKKLMSSSFWNMDKKLLSKNVDGVNLHLCGEHVDLPINSLDEVLLRPSLLQTMEAKIRQNRDRQLTL